MNEGDCGEGDPVGYAFAYDDEIPIMNTTISKSKVSQNSRRPVSLGALGRLTRVEGSKTSLPEKMRWWVRSPW